MKIGLYGGTFDPVHYGHLLLARDALEELGLNQIIFIPCALSPHKLGKMPTPGQHRVAMLRKAANFDPRFQVSTVEIQRKGPSYAIETAHFFRQTLPGEELFWLIGADQLPKLHTWERARELKQLLTFVVLARAGVAVSTRPGLLRLRNRRTLDLSATEIRTRLQEGLSISGLTPEPVVHYIIKHQLYRS